MRKKCKKTDFFFEMLTRYPSSRGLKESQLEDEVRHRVVSFGHIILLTAF